MAFTLMYNSHGRAVLHATANSTIVVAGNNSVSNIASGSQELSGASITRIWYGSDANWSITRGANLVYLTSGSGYHYFDGAALNLFRGANITATTESANGFIMIELKKEGNLG